MRKVTMLIYLLFLLKLNAQNDLVVYSTDPCLLNSGFNQYRTTEATSGIGNTGFNVFAGQIFNVDYTDSPLLLDSSAFRVLQLTSGLDYYLKLYEGEGDSGTELLSLLIDSTNTINVPVNEDAGGAVFGTHLITDLRDFNFTIQPNQTYTIGISYNDPTNTVFTDLYLETFSDVIQSGNAFYTGTGNDLTADVACLVRMEYTPHPTDISNTDITGTTATFSWEVVDIFRELDSFDWVVVDDGDLPTDIPVASGNTMTTSAAVTELTQNTSYDFYVRSNDDCLGNGSLSSNWQLFDFSFSTLSNNEYGIDEIKILPNPADSEIFLTDFNGVINEISIFDVLGKKVISSRNKSINVSRLKTGIYLVKIESAGVSTVKRFVKK